MAGSGRPAGWSRLQLYLHWLTVVLIGVQVFAGDWMSELWRARTRGEEIDSGKVLLGWIHAIVGVTILIATALRIWDRLTYGRPPYPADDPVWAYWLAKANHFLLYAILVVMPLLGAAAFLGGIEDAADLHEALWTPLLVLIALHVAGALAEHFYFRTDVLRRMLRPGSRGGRG